MTDWFEATEQTLFSLVAEHAHMRQIATGFAFTAGPVWHLGALLFTNVVRNRSVRYRRLPEGPEVTTVRVPSGYPLAATPRPTAAIGANSLTRDPLGWLNGCESGDRRVSPVERDGTIVLVAERSQGRRLTSPNEVVAHSSAAIEFTDPPMLGLADAGLEELPSAEDYRADPDGGSTLLVDDFILPSADGL